MLYLFAPSSQVLIGSISEPLTGTVIDVLISDKNYVQYKVEWWDGRKLTITVAYRLVSSESTP